MRTTVTLDPDVEALVRKVMRERGLGFKEAVNAGLRDGLGGVPRVDYSFPTYDLGEPLLDLTKANQLAAMLEDEALVEKARQGR